MKTKNARSKYKNVRSNGFDSIGEEECYQLLVFRQKAGEIRDLETQVRVQLTPSVGCRPDFKYFDVRLNQPVWADFKGFETAHWKRTAKLWRDFGPGLLLIYKGSGWRISVAYSIEPIGWRGISRRPD